jgi:hypothetical protein
MATCLNLLSMLREAASSGPWLRTLKDFCERAALDLDFCIGARTVARLGATARPNLFARLLGAPEAEIHPIQAGRAWIETARRGDV